MWGQQSCQERGTWLSCHVGRAVEDSSKLGTSDRQSLPIDSYADPKFEDFLGLWRLPEQWPGGGVNWWKPWVNFDNWYEQKMKFKEWLYIIFIVYRFF